MRKTVPSRRDKWNANVTLGFAPDADTLYGLMAGSGDGEARYAGCGMDGSQFKRESFGLRFQVLSLTRSWARYLLMPGRRSFKSPLEKRHERIHVQRRFGHPRATQRCRTSRIAHPCRSPAAAASGAGASAVDVHGRGGTGELCQGDLPPPRRLVTGNPGAGTSRRQGSVSDRRSHHQRGDRMVFPEHLMDAG